MGFPDRITPDLLQEVIDELQVRSFTEICKMAEAIDVSRTVLLALKRGSYRSVPTIDRVTRVHRWLAQHPAEPAPATGRPPLPREPEPEPEPEPLLREPVPE